MNRSSEAVRKNLFEKMADSVNNIVKEDSRVTIRELESRTGVSRDTVEVILKEKLNMNKVCARWIPMLLTEDDRMKRVAASSSFLARAEQQGDSFLDRIVTTDESMFNLFDPETKMESSVWKRAGSPPPLKARVTKSAYRLMFIFFMDRKGMLLVHAVPQGQTVNADYYSKVQYNLTFY